MKTLDKIINPSGDLFCKISITEDGKLSISGVEGPKPNGDARGSCGQIDMGYFHRRPEHNDKRYSNPKRLIHFNPGWNEALWWDFLEVWKEWHLNDMRANCEHQTGPDWTSKDVTIYHFRLTDEAVKMKDGARKAAVQSLETGAPFTPTAEQCFLGTLEHSLELDVPNPPGKLGLYYGPRTSLYAGDKGVTETKQTGWLKQSEHPEGFLSKACPVCGYRYGTSWLKKELPKSVIEFLTALPETKTQPAWV